MKNFGGQSQNIQILEINCKFSFEIYYDKNQIFDQWFSGPGLNHCHRDCLLNIIP